MAVTSLSPGAGFVPPCAEKELRTGKCPETNNNNSHEVKATSSLCSARSGQALVCLAAVYSTSETHWLPPPGQPGSYFLPLTAIPCSPPGSVWCPPDQWHMDGIYHYTVYLHALGRFHTANAELERGARLQHLHHPSEGRFW